MGKAKASAIVKYALPRETQQGIMYCQGGGGGDAAHFFQDRANFLSLTGARKSQSKRFV